MMAVTITPTDEFLLINGTIPVRVWQGTLPSGVVCRVLVAGVQVPDDQDSAEFDAALKVVNVEEIVDPRWN